MANPIINPSKLTQKQQELIRAEYDSNVSFISLFSGLNSPSGAESLEHFKGRNEELILLFGAEFFKKYNG